MALTSELLPKESLIRPGNSCLLCATGRHFLVEILDITEDTIHTTFPVTDYLVTGMSIDLEFHEAEGYLECRTEVVQEPRAKGDGVILRRPAQSYWNAHRGSNRVPTDLTVQVRDLTHPRRYDAELINLSSGGALVQTRASLAIPARVEIALSLPGEPQHTVNGRVAHISEGQMGGVSGMRRVGIRFVDLTSDSYESIVHYITHSLTQRES